MSERKQLLMIDDDPDFVEGIKSILKAKYDVDVAYNPKDGLAALQKKRYDLLLLDMTMPNVGGREVVDRLRASGRMVPTVAMSGNFERNDAAVLREWGVGMLAKPFHRDDLVKAVRAALAP